jgi:hypothetical protein
MSAPPEVPDEEVASLEVASEDVASLVGASEEVGASDDVGASDEVAAAEVVAAGVVVLALSLLDPHAVSTRPAAAIAATARRVPVLPKRTMDSLLFLTARS